MTNRLGFTLVELLIVVVIASILLGVAFPRVQAAFHQRDVNGARDGVLLLGAQARARAMEQGRTVEFHFDRVAGVAWVEQSGDTIQALDVGDQFGVDISSSTAHLVMCYTGRGFATEPCSTPLAEELEITFERQGHSAGLEVWQLGQMRKL